MSNSSVAAIPGRGGPLVALSLQTQFALIGGVVMLVAMGVVGNHISREIENSVTRNSAISAALYMESFIAPLSQALTFEDALAPDEVLRLDALFSQAPASDRIASIKIWKSGGRIVYSSDPALIGQSFEPSEHLRSAWSGQLTASFDDLDDAENSGERALGAPLLEVYNPIHSILTGEIIAVAEFYLSATELKDDLRAARLKGWGVVAIAMFGAYLALFGVVSAGGRTIARQTRELTLRLAQVAEFSAVNEALRHRVEAASLRTSETNERLLRRVSAELHDGPAQAVALALLRLESLARRVHADSDPEVAELRSSLGEALRNIRDLCRGLTLPEIEGKQLGEVLELVVSAHERRSGSSVARDFDGCVLPTVCGTAPHATLITIYRFIQEGLMNSFRHAGGRGQSVRCRFEGDALVVTVSDAGPGFDPERRGAGLGLSGLRERVESIGGEFHIASREGCGTQLCARLVWSRP